MTTLPLWLDLLLAVLLVAGAVFALAGSLALARLSTFMQRVHGPTMTMTLGAGLVLGVSVVVFWWHGVPGLHELLVVFFLFLTVPASSQMLVKAVLKRELQGGLKPPGPQR